MHAVHRLFQYRRSLSTTTYKSRGYRVIRCELCRLARDFCICEKRVSLKSNCAFLLLMYDTEILKPSNTGRLIADLIPETYAFLWSRTEVNNTLIDLIQNERFQPYVVFPAEYANSQQKVVELVEPHESNKSPLFILLDGSWREAKKMFRKSPYLNGVPVLSIDPQKLINENYLSKYQIRISAKGNQLATAEVASQVLALAGELKNAEILDCWFDVFSYEYQKSVCQTNKGNPLAEKKLEQLVNNL